MNVLLMRPGNIPSMPWVGINVRKYMYMFEDEIDIDQLKSDIYDQCSAIISYVSIGDVEAYFNMANGSSVLVINIPVEVNEATLDCTIGFQADSMSTDVKYNFQIEARKAS